MITSPRLIPVLLALAFSLLIQGQAWAHHPGSVSGDADLVKPPEYFDDILEEALDLLAEINPAAAQDYKDLIQNPSSGFVWQEPAMKDGEKIIQVVAGRYKGGVSGTGGPYVQIFIGMFGIKDPMDLVGTLLHEWKHWQGDKDENGDLDGDDGTDIDDGKPGLPSNPTQEDIDRATKHAELQLSVADDICFGNCDYAANHPLGLGLLPCSVIEKEYDQAAGHFAVIPGLLDYAIQIGDMADYLAEECCCDNWAAL